MASGGAALHEWYHSGSATARVGERAPVHFEASGNKSDGALSQLERLCLQNVSWLRSEGKQYTVPRKPEEWEDRMKGVNRTCGMSSVNNKQCDKVKDAYGKWNKSTRQLFERDAPKLFKACNLS